MIAFVLLSLGLIAVASAAPPATPPSASTAVSAANQVTPKPLVPVVINGVLFRAVEFDTGKVIWRNLAITVTADHLEAWRALSPAIKNAYAEQMVENYRTGMKYDRDIKLTFIDERSATLDQYLSTPPLPAKK